MSKPPGLALTLGPDGLGMHVTRSTYTQDKIWEAVQSAVQDGMSVDDFRRECAEAWAEERRQQAESEAAQWKRDASQG